MTDEKIYVTKPFLPPIEEYIPYLEDIWRSGQLTNHGPFHSAFEASLSDYFGGGHVALFNNGTQALIASLRVLELTGEVITTAYTFVATTHAITWNNLTPVFVDIDPNTFNLSPESIEAAITPKTTAILAVHCYGNPCNVEAIELIAQKHGLKLIYDAAHAFGVSKDNISLVRYGDLSIVSFHATKVMNTFEGGAVICHNADTKDKLKKISNFGFENATTILGVGMNAKMPETSAAMGLLQLKYVDGLIDARKKIDTFYREGFKNLAGIYCFSYAKDWIMNYGYFPILVQEDYPLTRDELFELLDNNGYKLRRYFYPLTSSIEAYNHFPSSSSDNLPVSHAIAKQVLCLPIYPELEIRHINTVIKLIAEQTLSSRR